MTSVRSHPENPAKMHPRKIPSWPRGRSQTRDLTLYENNQPVRMSCVNLLSFNENTVHLAEVKFFSSEPESLDDPLTISTLLKLKEMPMYRSDQGSSVSFAAKPRQKKHNGPPLLKAQSPVATSSLV